MSPRQRLAAARQVIRSKLVWARLQELVCDEFAL
jgi:hypothetical protein